MHILIDAQYLPSTLYFSVLAKATSIRIEKKEYFVKQTFRNRTHILTPNGIDVLSIPLRGSQKKIEIDKIKIDYTQKWKNRHWRAIKSAYGKAPFFDYYSNSIESVIYENFTTVFELNLKLIKLSLHFLKIDTPLLFTSSYQKEVPLPLIDFRSKIHPKKEINFSIPFTYIAYQQVFGSQFIQGMSILDLLFSEGPNAREIIFQQI